MGSMLFICEQFACYFDVKFNSLKSTVMHIGKCFDVKYAPLTLDGCKLQYVQCFKYLGLHILAGKHFKYCAKNAQMKFYRTFDCIYF